jgi:DNA-binding transcriptional LysR family regulator
MRNLNPDQLLAFVTVVEQGGFTSAAKVLNLTQPAVSLQVRELETRCGVTLINRESRRLRLTDAGEDMLDRAKRILSEHDAALAVMRRHQTKAVGELRVGLTLGTLTYMAAGTLRQLRRKHPTLMLNVRVAGSPDLAQMVRDNSVDLAVLALPVDLAELTATTFLRDRLVAIIPDIGVDLPATATPQFMAEQPLVSEPRYVNLRAMIADWFAAERVEPQRVMQVDTLEAIRSAVAAGLGAAIIPELVVRERPAGVAVLPLKPAMAREWAVVQRKDKVADKAMGMVRDAFLAMK